MATNDEILNEIVQTRMALSALLAALVQTLDASGVVIAKDFQKNLEKIYEGARDWEDTPVGLLENLKWTDDILASLGR